jgi:sec-independent protein translocase protein TatA
MLEEVKLVYAFLGGIGPTELLVIFAIVLLLFGGRKLPEVARSMGKAMRAFKEEAAQLRRQVEIEEKEAAGAREGAAEEQEKEAESQTIDIAGQVQGEAPKAAEKQGQEQEKVEQKG